MTDGKLIGLHGPSDEPVQAIQPHDGQQRPVRGRRGLPLAPRAGLWSDGRGAAPLGGPGAHGKGVVPGEAGGKDDGRRAKSRKESGRLQLKTVGKPHQARIGYSS